MKRPYLVDMTLAESEKAVLDTGVLFAINLLILHPLGMAIAFTGKNGEEVTELKLMTTRDKAAWAFASDTAAEGWAKLEKFVREGNGVASTTLRDAVAKRAGIWK